MKRNYPVTQTEKAYSTDFNLISTTDLKGKITYANAQFCEVAGFPIDELEGKPHNVVRHPDMPEAAFADLWSTLKQGKSWMGLVKNRCKNGDHYWVDAFVTPILSAGAATEYQSVRVAPTPEQVERAEHIYSFLNKGRLPWQHTWSLALKWRLLGCAFAMTAPVLVAHLASLPVGYTLLSLGLGVGLAAIAVSFCLRKFNRLVAEARTIIDNSLTQLIYTGSTDEVGAVQLALKMRASQLGAIVGRVHDASMQAQATAKISSDAGERTRQNIQLQQQKLEQLATAMQEMASTTQDMARNTSVAADVALQVQDLSHQGGQVLADSTTAIKILADQLKKASAQIHILNQQSSRIGEIVSVIGGIAEQTNLLALNAAIEAARAGDQGRGFAVVAEEVRALAKRTQESTHEIQAMTQSIRAATQNAVSCIADGEALSVQCFSKGEDAMGSFELIADKINTITDMNHQIASAVEEQSIVTEEMNQQITQVNDIARDTLLLGEETVALGQEVQFRLNQQMSLIEQFSRQQHTAATAVG